MITELTSDPKAALKGKPAAVVVFYASWCGDSKASEEYERKMDSEFAGRVEFFRLDAIEHEGIGDAYQVERYPTYIFFRKGKPARGVLVEPFAEGEVRNWLEMKLGGRGR
jgi:thiol-disulfide isomerase/thioredoxin